MKSSKLVTYLIQIANHEHRIQIARQILAHNMNFSPAWLLTMIKAHSSQQNEQQKQKQQEGKNIKITQFKNIFTLIGFSCLDSQLITMFNYFDNENVGKIRNQVFIDLLMPSAKESLRKAVIKRTVEDIQFNFQIKFALRRFFKEILMFGENLRAYQSEFGNYHDKILDQQPITKQKLCAFFNKFGKYPTQTELNLIYNYIIQGRMKQVHKNQILSIIAQSAKDVEIMSKNPNILRNKIQNQLQNLRIKQIRQQKQTKQIHNILIKGIIQRRQPSFKQNQHKLQNQSHKIKNTYNTPQSQQKPLFQVTPKSDKQYIQNPTFKITRTNSIIHNQATTQGETQLKKANKIASELLNLNLNLSSSKIHDGSTPFKKIQISVDNDNTRNYNKTGSKSYNYSNNTNNNTINANNANNGSISNKTIYYPNRKKYNESELSQLINANLQVQSQIQQSKRENIHRIVQAKRQLNYL